MMAGFTQGTWQVMWSPYLLTGGRYWSIVNEYGETIAGEGVDSAGESDALLICASKRLYRELRHLVLLLEPLEQDGGLDVPGLATLNGARKALDEANPEWRRQEPPP